MSVLPPDYGSDPDRFLSTEKFPHDDVHPYVAARFAVAGARTVLALAPGPKVRADGSRLPVADESVDAVAALFTLYHYADPRVPIREAEAARAAATLDLPLRLTKRGRVIYATKGGYG